MHTGRAALLLLALLLLPYLSQAASAGGYLWTRTVTLEVPAVARTETGFIGVMSKLVVTVAAPGHGIVYVSADPLTELDMQAAARMAALVATTLTGFDYYSFDYFIHVASNTSIVGGPSASGAMAVAIMAALRGTKIRPDFSMTGMVDPDATLGPVGGIPEKLLAAADAGVKVFVIPAGQEEAVDLNTGMKVDVVKLGAQKGVKVIPAKTIVDAYVAATGDDAIRKEIPKVGSVVYPDWLRSALEESAERFKQLAEGNITCLKKMLESVPNAAREPFTSMLAEAEKELNEGKEYAKEGLYYSAASRFFGSAILSTSACLLAKAVLADNPVKYLETSVARYLDAANATLNIVEPAIRGSLYRSKNLTDVAIQLAVATLIRVNDARNYLKQSRQLLSSIVAGETPLSMDTLQNIIDDSVYSYYRSITAKQWLSLYQHHRGGKPVTPGRLRTATYMMTYFADSTASYSITLGVPAQAAQTLLEHAKLLLSHANTTTDYIEALVYAIRGYALTTTHLRAAFLTGPEGVEAAKEGLSLLLGLATAKGLTPILPSLYREYGSTLNGTAALSIYIQGASYALLLNTLVPGRKPSIETSASQVGGETNAKTVTATVVKTVTVTVTKPSGEKTTTTVPVTVTATGTVTEKTVTLERTVTTGKTVYKTVTTTVRVAGNAGWTALFITGIVALLAGVAAGRMGRES